jgi:LCP family protein required for cell wall assembly
MSILGSTLRGWAKAYALALGVALTLTVSGLVGVNVMIDNKIDGIERVDVDVEPNTDPAEPANFLLIGSDTREFVESAEEEEAFGDPETETGQRSDTIMIVHVDPEAQTGLLVSFPRDLVVDIPGIGEEKINAAFNNGPQAVIDTIEHNFDIPIHHYLEIDFASFQGIVDAVGGVPVYLPAPARDEQTGFEITGYFNFQPGCYELDGRLALGYVRSRSFELYVDGEWQLDGSADIGRIVRQQNFMRRLAAEAVATALSNPLKANSIADESLAQLTADEGLGRDDVNKLINAFRNVDPSDEDGSIQMVTVPYVDDGNGSTLSINEELAAPLFDQLRQFTPPEAAPDGPAPSSIRVRVFNGSGQDGAAAATLEALEAEGFLGAGTGNNPDGNIEATEVHYRPGSEDKAQVVLDYLGGAGTLVEDDSVVDADVLLVIGEEFDGLAPPVDAGADPTATTAVPAPTESSVEEGTEPEQEPTPGAEPTAPETQC